jgi:restriction system protein
LAILQCKAWGSRSVGVKTVRELVRVMAHNAVDAGVLLITGEFTDGATEFAKSHRIALGSGERFLKKLTSLPPDIQRDLLDVACSGAWTTPSCPSCGTKMVERGGDSKRFWGCATFPRCRQTFLMRGVA